MIYVSPHAPPAKALAEVADELNLSTNQNLEKQTIPLLWGKIKIPHNSVDGNSNKDYRILASSQSHPVDATQLYCAALLIDSRQGQHWY
jgi:hypothetical protein